MAAKLLSTEIVFESESELCRAVISTSSDSLEELNISKQEFMSTCEINNYEKFNIILVGFTSVKEFRRLPLCCCHIANISL